MRQDSGAKAQPVEMSRRAHLGALFALFSRYGMVGVLNTALHWLVFFVVFHWLGLSQSLSNLIAFAVAVTFSFFANTRFTFKTQASLGRYLLYVSFLGALAYATGLLADRSALAPLVTLVLFSGLSLVVGFLYSRFILFRSRT